MTTEDLICILDKWELQTVTYRTKAVCGANWDISWSIFNCPVSIEVTQLFSAS